MKAGKNKQPTEPYKGVRDFYPEDMFVQNYLFGVMRKVAERFGYVEYNASILEPAELYKNKTSEEIVNEQTYTFTDRGKRDVTLRPEMTPTVARMIAAKRRELPFPLRWYSIANFFRYERPQRGRVREHWQLNADIFGISSIEAEIETISIAHSIMKEFGAKDADFQIKINDRKLLQGSLSGKLKSASLLSDAIRLIDKKDKISDDEFETEWKKLSNEPFALKTEANAGLNAVIQKLSERGISNVVYEPTLTRGFDYYTGIVFEVLDTNSKNKRSLFGGGRYDNLLELFDEEKVPAVGFGMGDVTIRDFIETHELLPSEYHSTANLIVIPVGLADLSEANRVANTLREHGLNVAIDLTERKLGDKIKNADRQSIPYALIVGEEETNNKAYKLKNLKTHEEKTAGIDEISRIVKK